jgi:hypothetical protein
MALELDTDQSRQCGHEQQREADHDAKANRQLIAPGSLGNFCKEFRHCLGFL